MQLKKMRSLLERGQNAQAPLVIQARAFRRPQIKTLQAVPSAIIVSKPVIPPTLA